MSGLKVALAGGVVVCFALVLAAQRNSEAPPSGIPPYYESEAAAKPFPVTLPPETFPHPVLQKVYRIAKEIPGVLAQQPCYCYCNRMKHKGLLDCHRDSHSAG
ncbi:MAG: hypothetical protein FJW39_19100 [Acidobacteria bacterium]|nr:hypothetical protein [Acidobacteriota bacterium]